MLKHFRQRMAKAIDVPEPVKNDERPGDSLPVVGSLGMKVDPFAIYDVDAEKLENHVPAMSLQELHPKTAKALTAIQIKNLNKKRADIRALNARDLTKVNVTNIPHLYANPMQHLDYRIYETLMKHTFVGTLVDSFVQYIVGTGFKPELELVNPDEDDEKNKELIDKYQHVITDLKNIDRQVEVNDAGHLDVGFREKITAIIMSCIAYNRGALIFQYEKPIEINGKKYENIPSNLIFAHAQDLGIIETDGNTRRMSAVQWKHSAELVKNKDMMYMWNPVTSSKVHNAWYYGMSTLSPMISASKIMRQLLAEDFPAMARTTWAGLYLLVVKNEGQTKDSKQAEWEEFNNKLKVGTTGVIVKDPEDVDLHNIDFNPKIQEFQGLFEMMAKMCTSILRLPQVGFFDESAANRATMVGKIQLTMRTVIEPTREWMDKMISDQWYMRWVRELYAKSKPEILDLFRIKLSWSDLHISEWYDNLEAALELDGRQQLKDNEFGPLIGVDNYPSMVDKDAEVTPGGAGNNKMSMTDPNTGNKMDIKTKKGNLQAPKEKAQTDKLSQSGAR